MPSLISTVPIRLIVGLGNPGNEYEATRHNAGFWFVDAVAASLGVNLSRDAKFFGATAKAKYKGNDVFLVKPGTYMNRSGQAVQSLANFFKITPAEMCVLHDELDLMPGTIKMKLGGGTGGHNGLKDIQARIASPDYWRVKIGIGHPRTLNLTQEVADFVLHPPRRDDREAIEANIVKFVDILPHLLEGNCEEALRLFHTKPKA